MWGVGNPVIRNGVARVLLLFGSGVGGISGKTNDGYYFRCQSDVDLPFQRGNK